MEKNKVDENKVKKLIHSLALKYNMTDKDFTDLVNSPYQFAEKEIRKLDLSKVETEEELNNIKTNFYFKCFFKLHIPFDRVKRRNERANNINNLNKWKK